MIKKKENLIRRIKTSYKLYFSHKKIFDNTFKCYNELFKFNFNIYIKNLNKNFLIKEKENDMFITSFDRKTIYIWVYNIIDHLGLNLDLFFIWLINIDFLIIKNYLNFNNCHLYCLTWIFMVIKIHSLQNKNIDITHLLATTNKFCIESILKTEKKIWILFEFKLLRHNIHEVTYMLLTYLNILKFKNYVDLILILINYNNLVNEFSNWIKSLGIIYFIFKKKNLKFKILKKKIPIELNKNLKISIAYSKLLVNNFQYERFDTILSILKLKYNKEIKVIFN